MPAIEAAAGQLFETVEGLGGIAAELPGLVETELAHIDAHWPTGLPQSVIHADLFPDNVLLRGNSVSAMIDFYFACTGMMAFDLAVTHAAWSFADGGRRFRPDVGAALIAGYETRRTLDPKERAALPTLARGAARLARAQLRMRLGLSPGHPGMA